jgi:hypothetical protein
VVDDGTNVVHTIIMGPGRRCQAPIILGAHFLEGVEQIGSGSAERFYDFPLATTAPVANDGKHPFGIGEDESDGSILLPLVEFQTWV